MLKRLRNLDWPQGIAFAVLGLILFAAVLIWWTDALTRGKRAEAEARVTGNRAEAAAASASDAVNRVGAQASEEADSEGKVKDAQRNVDRAPDAAGADAAGRSGLCAISPALC